MLMHIVKKILVGLFALLLSTGLFMTVLVWQVKLTAGDPTWVKEWVSGAGTYEKLVNSLSKSIDKTQENSLPLDDPELLKAVESAFPPEFLKSTSEKFIDGLESWLNGNQAATVELDLTNAKVTLADNLGEVAKNKLTGLPTCAIPPESPDIDVFRATCLPVGADIESLSNSIRENINDGQDILKDPVISVKISDVAKNQPLVSEYAPKVYRYLDLLAWILIAWLIVSVLVIVGLSDNHRQAMKRVAKTLLTTGVILAVWGVIMIKYQTKLIGGTQQGGQASQDIFKDIVLPLIESGTSAWMKIQLFAAAIMVVVASGLFIYLRLTKKKAKQSDKSSPTNIEGQDTPNENAGEPKQS
jgi:hypothetical protein